MKKSYLISSVILSILIVITAIYGLFFPGAYAKETANWTAQCMAQDWIDLVVAAPLLLISALFAYRKSIAGYIIWLGTLFFVIYSFLIYAFMVHFNLMFLPYVSILGISSYLTIFALISADYKGIQKAFKENWSRKWVSNILVTLGVLFYLVWFKDIINAQMTSIIPKSMEEAGLVTNGVYVIDIALCLPLLILSGYYLRKQKTAGYLLAGASIVFSIIMMTNIAAIIFYVGYKELPTDYSIAYVFGFLAIVSALISTKFLRSFK